MGIFNGWEPRTSFSGMLMTAHGRHWVPPTHAAPGDGVRRVTAASAQAGMGHEWTAHSGAEGKLVARSVDAPKGMSVCSFTHI